MTTGRQVDRLIWAAAEAHRLRTQGEGRRTLPLEPLGRDPRVLHEAFVTEWQPADRGTSVSY